MVYKIAFIMCLSLLALSSVTRADMYSFENITNNSATNATNGEAQLSVNVTASGSNTALFTFNNAGPNAMVIAQIYFDNGSALNSIHSIINGSGVSFSAGGSPPNLPGGNDALPPFSSDFRATADNPAPTNGVGINETVGIKFNLAGGFDFQDLIDELNNETTRVGIHVQAFANGGSESFITTVTNKPIPAPAAVWLGVIGMGCVRIVRRHLS